MKPETRDNLNLVATVIGVVMIPLAGAFLNSKLETTTAQITAHSDANVAALKQAITEQYETQAAHKTDMNSMTEWNKTISQSQRDLSDKVDKNNVEQRLAIQHVSDKIESLKPSN